MRLPRAAVPILVAGVFGTVWVGRSPLRAADDTTTDKVFLGYVFRTPREINYKLYTHLAHAFLVADADGNIRERRNVPSRELTGEAHQAGVKVILSLGGWGWDEQFAAIASKPEAEQRYVKRVIEIVDEFDYDGIDFDWEYPDTEQEVVGFERMCRQFRKRLDEIGRRKGRHMVLTMAASANPGTLKWLTNDLLLQNMDWINVMTYDYAGTWTPYAGHHSPLFASSRVPQGRARSTELTMKYLLQRGMPAERLAVGIPLYGRGFAVAEPYASTEGVRNRRAPGGNYARLHELLQEQGWKRVWDDETKNPWLIAPDRSAVIGYDDEESVSIKTEWAMTQGFRGVFFWQIAADQLRDRGNPLQEASHRKWQESVNGKKEPK
jgi:chitinase